MIGKSLGIEQDEEISSSDTMTRDVVVAEPLKGVSQEDLTKISEEALHDGFVDLKCISDHTTAMALELFASIDSIDEKVKPRVLEVAAQLMKSSVDAIKQSQDAALKHIERAKEPSKPDGTPPPSNNQFNFFGDRNELMRMLTDGEMKNITGEKR